MSGFKKLAFALVMVAVTVACCMCMVGDSNDAYAAEVVESGTAPNGVVWSLTDNGEMFISGNGLLDMYDLFHEAGFDRTRIVSVTIHDGIQIIGSSCFRDCSSLKSVSIPNSVISISDHAFMDCSSLEKIVIPESVSYLSDVGYQFGWCTSLKSVEIKGNITKLPEWVFAGCASVQAIILPENLKEIHDYAFFYCESLKDIVIPDGVRYIGDHVFTHSGLEVIIIPGTVWYCGSIGSCPSLKRIVLEPGVHTFEGAVDCENLETVAAYDGIYDIGGCVVCPSLTSIVIPSTVSLSPQFRCCQNLTEIVFYGTEPLNFWNDSFDLGDGGTNHESQPVTVTIYTNGGWGSNEVFTNEVLGEYTQAEFSSFNATVPDHKIFVREMFNSGSNPCTIIAVADGSIADKPADPSCPGYVFDGWYANSNYTVEYDWSAPVYGDDTVYAKFTPITYNIIFDLCGGSVIDDVSISNTTHSVNSIGTFPSSDSLMKEGHTFEGWYVDPEYDLEYCSDYPLPASDVRLYAKWEPIVCTVTFESNGGTAIDPLIVEYGSVLNEPNSPIMIKYRFGGWFTDSEFNTEYDWESAVTSDFTLYAKWILSPETLIVIFESNGGSDVPSQEKDYNSTLSEPDAPTKLGYYFDGWYADSDCTMEYDWSTPIITNLTLYAKWIENRHTVSYESNGGTAYEDSSALDGHVAPYPGEPVREGHTFAGWYKDSALTQVYDWNSTVTGDLTLYAKWTINTYTITFDRNGGTSTATIEVVYGQIATEPADPTRLGYFFDKWYTDEDCTVAYDWSAPVKEDLTLYAGWIENRHTVSYESNGGTAYEDSSALDGYAAPYPGEPTKEGHTFDGWFTDSGCTVLYDFKNPVPVTEDIVLYAGWTIVTNKVVFETYGGTNVPTQTVDYGSTPIRPDDPVRIGYEFGGWYAYSSFTYEYDWSAPITKVTWIYAKWIPIYHEIVFHSNGGSDVESIQVLDSHVADMPDSPTMEGHTFRGWFTDPDCTLAYDWDTIVTTDLMLYAKWEIQRIYIHFESNEGSAVESLVVDYGTIPEKPADPTKDGYNFMGWYEDETCMFLPYEWDSAIKQNLTLYAKWELKPIEHTITFESNGGSDVGPIVIENGQVATKPTDPTKVKHTFAGWYTDGDLTERYVWSNEVTSSFTLYAKWTYIPDEFTIMFDTDGGSVIEDMIVLEGSKASKPVDPTKEGHTFAGWYTDGDCTVAYDWSAPVTEDFTLYAGWTIKTVYLIFETYGGTQIPLASYEYGAIPEKPTDPTRLGYLFDKWYTDEGLDTEYVWGEPLTETINLYAGWTENKHIVTFDRMDGSETTEITVLDGYRIYEPEKPIRDGYAFAGWYTDSDEVYDWNHVVTESFTLYAKWTYIPDEFTIMFDTDGGSVIEDMIVLEGSKATKPVDPTKEGHTFAGWYTDEDCTVAYDWSAPVTEDFTLYAGWTIKTVYLIFETYGGTQIPLASYEYGAIPEKPTDPTRLGYFFDKWYVDEDCTVAYDWSVPVTETINLYAGWTENRHTVTFDRMDGSETTEITVLDGYRIYEPEKPIRDGYAFAGWYTDSGCSVAYDFDTPVVGDMTLYAKWEKDTVFYTISLDLDGGTGIQSITVKEGESAIRPSNPIRAGFEFLGWYTDSDEVYDWELSVNEDFTLHAKWKEIVKHTVTFVINGDDETIIDPRQVEDGKVVIRPDAPTKDGYEFDGWYTDSGCSVAYDFDTPVVGDMTLYAKWNKIVVKHTIAFNTNGASVIEPMEVIDGQIAVKPTDPTKSGYRFDGWYMDSEFVTEYDWSSVVTGSMVLHAKWTELDLPQVEFTVSFNTNGGSDVPSQRVLLNGCAVEPDAPTKDSSTFVGWFADFECEIPFVWSTPITQDTIVHAKWEYVPPVGPVMITVYVDGVATEVEEGSTTNAIPNPTKDGHTFTGWFRDEGCTEPVGAGVLSDGQYIYSGWSEVIVPEPPVEHTVTFVIHDDVVSTKVVTDGYVVERPTDPVREGYTFVGWYTTIGYEERYDFGTPVMQDISIYAKWTENIVPEPTEYTVSFNTNGGSDVEDMIVLEGSKVSKPVDPTKGGYTFAGWFKDSELTQAYDWDTEVVSDMVLYAKWIENIVPEPEEYTVTFDSNGGSVVDDMVVTEGSKATKPADPTKGGHTFVGWFMDSGLTEVYDWDSTVTGDMTLYAKWHEITIEKHTVRFTANGGSAVEDLTVNKGEKAVKPADPTKDGYRFDGWYTNAALTQAYDWDSVVNEDLVLYAKWLSNIVVDDSDEKDSDDDNMVSQIVQLSMIVGGALLILVGIRTRPAVIILGILLAIGGIVDVSSILEMIGIEGL